MNMRAIAALLTVLCVPALAPAQTPPAPAPAQPAPARPRPRAPAAAATAVLTVTVNDSTGAPLEEVKVSATGPVDREGETTAGGQVRMLGIRAGTYRLRFEKDGFYTLEKEVSWRAGTPAPTAEATLNAAPPPPPPPEPPKPEPPSKPAAPDYPAGKPANLSIPDYIEKNHITNKEPHKENLIGCSGGAQTWLWQVRDPWTNRSHEAAELMLYVVGGEGTVAMGGRDVSVAAGTYLLIPRGTTYAISKRGRSAAVYILATLSGPPCAQ
jgi:mannose-6-phosphate isomerase-like protein (cupin superfamily)